MDFADFLIHPLTHASKPTSNLILLNDLFTHFEFYNYI